MSTVAAAAQGHATSSVSPGKGQVAKRLEAVLLVLVTLFLWFIFALLSQAIVTAVPNVGACMRERGIFACLTTAGAVNSRPALGQPATSQDDPAQRRQNTQRTSRALEVAVLIISLLAALWAASRAVYPPDDFDNPDLQRS
jgi:hypothetical protein